ncbi:TRAP transporter small permease [Rhizobium halophytocola]|uniref:TRAP transporter small permease n=1 Tax=Rhizobium halophytocola TaxID=735519 RepID=UPI001AE8D61D|nr:TRAP transporter small permease [Rhizobium halophytocola]
MLVIPIAALTAMMLITVADVFMRYVFNAPISGSYDIVEICLLVSVYFALPSVILEGEPILIDLIDGMISPRALFLLKAVAALVCVLVLCFIFWSMLTPAHEAYEYGDVKLELGLPVWIIWAFALFGIFNSVIAAVLAFRHLRQGLPSASTEEGAL